MENMASESLSCPICLDPLKDPWTLICGHNYCKDCIKGHWDAEENQNGGFSCPQCRRACRKRPSLSVNLLLAELVEAQKKLKLPAVPGDPAGPGDVACDVCTDRKLKAIMSCLVCQASYCQEHLKPHHQSAAFKTHKLVEPCKEPQNICFTHGKVKKYFCLTDRQSVCHLCTREQHRKHSIVPAAQEKAEKQKEVEESRRTIQQSIREREEEVRLLQKQQQNINRCTGDAEASSKQIFGQLIRLLRERKSSVTQVLRSDQQKLEQQVEELKWRDGQLEQLLKIEGHNQFLQIYTSLPALCPSTTSPVIRRPPLNCSETKTVALLEGTKTLEELLRLTWENIPIMTQPEPTTKAELLRYSATLTLDPNTVNNFMVLSEGNKSVTEIKECKNYPDHPDRFTGGCHQVLSRESLTGRCYWEVEWKPGEEGIGDVTVAVSYKSISRVHDLFSKESCFGFNNKSWALNCDKERYEYIHNSIKAVVPGPRSTRLGVFLDQPAGTLSFYSITKTLTLLHRVNTSFTEPLHAGITLGYEGDSAEIMGD